MKWNVGIARLISTAREHGPWTRPVNTAREHGPWTRPVNTDREHGPWTRPVNTAREHGPWTRPVLRATKRTTVNTAREHGRQILLPVFTARVHGPWTRLMWTDLKLSAAVHELSCYQRKNVATMPKTILPLLPRPVKKKTCVFLENDHSLVFNRN